MSEHCPDGVTGPRPRGRPRVQEPGSAVTTWLPVTLHDRLIQLSQQEQISVSAVVKALIVLRLK